MAAVEIIETKMAKLTIPETIDFVWYVAILMQEPVFLWGQPGVGKSMLMQQLANKRTLSVKEMLVFKVKTNKIVLIDIRLSQYDSVDLRGFPSVHKDGTTVWHVPSTLPFENNPRFGDDCLYLVFFDEMNAAQAGVLATAYQLINDKACGEHKLRTNVVLAAAGNREGDKGVTNRMPLPLANRMTHIEVVVSADAWCEWAQEVGLSPIGIAYILWRKEELSTFDPARTDKAFATPRTWEKALKYYASDMPLAIKQAAMIGAIGPGPAQGFWGFVDVWMKITPLKTILADPDGTPVPTEPSMQYATTVNISGAMDMKTVKALHRYLSRFPVVFIMLAWTLAGKRDDSLFSTPEFLDYAKKYKGIYTPSP